MKSLIKGILAILSIFLLFLIAFYFWASSPFQSKADSYSIHKYRETETLARDTFSIMTYNIGYLSGLENNLPYRTPADTTFAHLDTVIRVVQSIRPDFIDFQEIDFYARRSYYFNQLDSIGKRTGFLEGAMAVNWNKRYVPYPYWPPSVNFGKLLSGQAILSNYEIVENKAIILPKPLSNPFYYNAFYLDRLIQYDQVRIPGGKPFWIINVHLEAFDKYTRQIDSDILVEFLKSIPPGVTYLLTGDFNSSPPYKGVSMNDERTIKNILDFGLVPAIDENTYLSAPEKYMTFNSGHPVEKIDYIFYDPEKIQKVSAEVVRSMGQVSDHLPVFMKFVFKN